MNDGLQTSKKMKNDAAFYLEIYQNYGRCSSFCHAMDHYFHLSACGRAFEVHMEHLREGTLWQLKKNLKTRMTATK
jgi:hypothetical protein